MAEFHLGLLAQAAISGAIRPNGVHTGGCETFIGKMRDEFLNRELFDTMFEA